MVSLSLTKQGGLGVFLIKACEREGSWPWGRMLGLPLSVWPWASWPLRVSVSHEQENVTSQSLCVAVQRTLQGGLNKKNGLPGPHT